MRNGFLPYARHRARLKLGIVLGMYDCILAGLPAQVQHKNALVVIACVFVVCLLCVH